MIYPIQPFYKNDFLLCGELCHVSQTGYIYVYMNGGWSWGFRVMEDALRYVATYG